MLVAGAGAVVIIAGARVNYALGRDQVWDDAAATTGGDPARGEAMFIQYGCGSCHAAKHVRMAGGSVGPSMDGIGLRAMIAGKLANNPDNLQRWIRDPQSVSPGTDMPDLHVGEKDARDISAFLYTRTGG
jgi:cytochrome c2